MDVTTNPALITAANGNDTTLVFKCNMPVSGPTVYAQIEVITGTFQFNVGASADDADCPTYVAGDTVPLIPFELSTSSDKALHFHAANTSETFKIAIV